MRVSPESLAPIRQLRAEKKFVEQSLYPGAPDEDIRLRCEYYSAAVPWVFSARIHQGTGKSKVLRLYQIAKTVIERHIKVRGEANPYDPVYTEYFERRRSSLGRTLPCRRAGQILPAGV